VSELTCAGGRDTFVMVQVRIIIPRLRLTRAGIFIILAALVALLGAAAKHSQYDGPHSGYLSKAVKMAGTRVQPDTGSLTSCSIASPATETWRLADEQPVFSPPAVACFTPISLSSPPLRA
jgi:hypothetical protein